MVRLILLCSLCAVLLSACLSSADLDFSPDFKEVSDLFVQAVRWQDFQGASKLIAADERDAFLEEFHRDKDLHMVDVQFERVDLNEEAGEAEAVLFVEYYLLPSPSLKEWRWTQQWRRAEIEDPEGKDEPKLGPWQVASPPPAFP